MLLIIKTHLILEEETSITEPAHISYFQALNFTDPCVETSLKISSIFKT